MREKMTNTIRTTGFQALVAALVSARKAAGLSQRDLAAKLDCLPATTANIETGQRRVDVIELVALARALNISAADLFAVVLAEISEGELTANFSRPRSRK